VISFADTTFFFGIFRNVTAPPKKNNSPGPPAAKLVTFLSKKLHSAIRSVRLPSDLWIFGADEVGGWQEPSSYVAGALAPFLSLFLFFMFSFLFFYSMRG